MNNLQKISIGSSLAAAILWFFSAMVNVPVLYSGWGTLDEQLKNGAIVNGTAHFYTALKTISFLNAAAAICAGLSAVTQALSMRSPSDAAGQHTPARPSPKASVPLPPSHDLQ